MAKITLCDRCGAGVPDDDKHDYRILKGRDLNTVDLCDGCYTEFFDWLNLYRFELDKMRGEKKK